MKFTVLGASGFIGRNLVVYLLKNGYEVFAPGRDDQSIFSSPLGNVIYCIGVTSDFRSRPFDTVRAHVSVLSDVLEHANFQSLLYLSSTRVYEKSSNTFEDAPLMVQPADASDLYNLSKLMGESLCLNSGRTGVRVARLSNVVGFNPESTDFLSDLIRDALKGKIILRSDPSSMKDYVAIDTVTSLLTRIALQGCERVYNVAGGHNIKHSEILDQLQSLTGCAVEIMPGSSKVTFPSIEVGRLIAEFNERFAPFSQLLAKLIQEWQASVVYSRKDDS